MSVRKGVILYIGKALSLTSVYFFEKTIYRWNDSAHFSKQQNLSNPTLTSFQKFALEISQSLLYDNRTSTVNDLLKDLAQMPFNFVKMDGSSQLKLILRFADGGQAVLRPMRFPRNQSASIYSLLTYRYCSLLYELDLQ